MNAGESDSVIFVGNGATGAVHKLIHALNFKQPPVSVTSPFNPKYQRTNSPVMSPYFSYKSTLEKLLKYEENSQWVIISLILMTSGIE